MGQSSQQARRAGLIAIGVSINIAALSIIAIDVEGRFARIAIGVMIPATAVALLGVVLGRMQFTQAHFDDQVDANATRIAAVERRIDEGESAAYRRGLQDGHVLDVRRQARIT